MRYKYVLWDLDGTISKSGEGIYNALDYALEKFGIVENDMERKRSLIGPPLRTSFANLYGFEGERMEAMMTYYREYYHSKGWLETEIYEGIKEVILALKEQGITIMLATAKPEKSARRIVEQYGLMEYFDFISAAGLNGTFTEKDMIIQRALDGAGCINKAEALMIGDRSYDIIGAQTVGIDCCGVSFGYGGYDELLEYGATYIVDNAYDILNIVFDNK